MPKLILASGSDARARMLMRAGLEIETVPARIDEDAVRATLAAEGATPRDTADALAEAKALKVSARNLGALVLGADQILELDGEVLTKPADRPAAHHQLLRLRGRRHQLHSAAVAVEGGEPVWRHVGTARLHVRAFSDGWLDAYLDRNWERVRGSVGSYLVEEEGVRLFDRVDGDTFTVMGLPLVPLLSWLTIRGSISG